MNWIEKLETMGDWALQDFMCDVAQRALENQPPGGETMRSLCAEAISKGRGGPGTEASKRDVHQRLWTAMQDAEVGVEASIPLCALWCVECNSALASARTVVFNATHCKAVSLDWINHRLFHSAAEG